MTPNEISRVQAYLQRTFGNRDITIAVPAKPNAPVEISVGGEFIGVLYRDDDEGEVSYSVQISILAEDLPPAGVVAGKEQG